MRKTIIAGNWKMHKTTQEAIELAKKLKMNLEKIEGTEVVLCPPFTSLKSVYEVIKDSPIRLGAQNIFWKEEGAYTGEISPSMIKDVGCDFVILGHSERRKYFNEDERIINRKIRLVFTFELIPIVCIGENLEEREKGLAEEIVIKQMNNCFAQIPEKNMYELIIAYEPVWAIGTGRTATPEVADEMHQVIRNQILKLFSSSVASHISILYGGSVNPENIDDLMRQENIDGVLVGGASLNSKAFSRIVKFKKLNLIT